MATNNTANVSVGKGVVGGYFFTAPVGTTLPTNFGSTLDTTKWLNVGYLSDEGITASQDADNSDFNDLNGDMIASSMSSKTRTLGLQFVEVNEVSAKESFGQSNVTVDASGNMTIVHNNDPMDHRSGVIEAVLRDGRRWRRVIPDMCVTEWDDMTIVSSELVMFPVTYTLYADATGNYIYDYIQSTEDSES